MVRRRGMTVIQEFAERMGVNYRRVDGMKLHDRRMPIESFRLILGRRSGPGKTAAVRARMNAMTMPRGKVWVPPCIG